MKTSTCNYYADPCSFHLKEGHIFNINETKQVRQTKFISLDSGVAK